MEILFKNETTLNKLVNIDLCKVTLNPFIRPMLLTATFVYLCLAIYGYLVEDYMLVMVCLFLVPIMLMTPIQIYRSNGAKVYKQQKVLLGDEDPIINITVFEDYLELNGDFSKANTNNLLINKNNLDAKLPHDRISLVYKTKNVFVLIYEKEFALAIDKDKFTTGSSERFEEFLLTKGIKIKQK
ncbi:hypothetical protein [Turicibacter sp. TJ11]|uniref:hypothetical protein n=1 Tax=Turicibacter sp. TJ11 TaxID=2806443 RepID=UPI001F381D8B|nr:hypothetical protein [Turicibacter sp. TJ11]